MLGIIFNSFSVAVLMSNLTVGIALLGGAFLSATDAARVGVAEIAIDGVPLETGVVDNVGNLSRASALSPRVADVDGLKTVKTFEICERAFSRPTPIPQPPIFSCFASSSNC